MSTYLFFRDSLTIDANLPARLATAGIKPVPGDTLVLGAAKCLLSTLSPDFNYVILADSLLSGSPIAITATSIPAPSVSVFANSIGLLLTLTVSGMPGAPGLPGNAGDDGGTVTVGGKPKVLPGEDGGPGQNGAAGGPGGTVIIRYATAAIPPSATVPGGPGGKGGAGGKGGKGNPPGKRGANGRNGPAGPAGTVSVQQVAAGKVFAGLQLNFGIGWSEYRTDVGEYLFRLFDPNSQLHALAEFNAALELNPANTRAATLRNRIIQQQTPGGIPRDLDMAPDYKDISAGLLGETQLVLSEYLALQGTATQQEIADATKDQLSLVVQQMNDRLNEARLDVTVAGDGVQVADAERQMYSDQAQLLQQQITALQNQRLSLGDLVTTLGAAVGAISGLATGVGAIVSIPGALAAADNPQSGISKVLGFLATGKSFWDTKDVGGDLTDLLKGGQDAFTNFSKIYDEVTHSSSDATIKQLTLQVAMINMQYMVANLRRQQARDMLAAAQARVTDYAAEIQSATTLLNKWSATQAFLAQAVGVMLGVARNLTALVAEDVFMARRALEIYQLEDASSVRFDYGWLHPDQDNDLALQPLQRGQLSLQSVTALPTQVITWNDIFVDLNESITSGFDVVHPVIEVVIDDPAALAGLRQGSALRFSVGIGPDPSATVIPANIFELKVNNLGLTLTGASATGVARMWIQHTGHWFVKRRPTAAAPNPPDVEFSLFPHLEVFNIAAGTNNVSGQIPAQPQSGAEPGPPFSFWGRGALADWSLFTDASSGPLNLSGLTAVRLTIGCIGLVAQGTPAPKALQLKSKPTLLSSGSLEPRGKTAGASTQPSAPKVKVSGGGGGN
jgi:hypothetical protein